MYPVKLWGLDKKKKKKNKTKFFFKGLYNLGGESRQNN